MISNSWIITPCGKLNIANRDSSTSFTCGSLSKVTFRSQQMKKKSKINLLTSCVEEPASQTNSFFDPTKVNILYTETSSNSDNVVKNNILKADETVLKKHFKNSDTVIKVEKVIEERQIFDTTNNSYCKKPKKHKKKKHKQHENYIKPKNDKVVHSSYNKEIRGRSKLLEISEGKTNDVTHTETSSNSDSVIKNNTLKADETNLKRHSKNSDTVQKVETDYINVIEEQQVFETTNNSFCIKSKKHKKEKHKHHENYIKLENVEGVHSSFVEANRGKNKQLEISEEKFNDAILNQRNEEKAVALYKLDSPVIKSKDSKPTKRKLSLSQSCLDHNILDESIQYSNYKKLKRKIHRSNSHEVERKHDSYSDNNNDNLRFGENLQLIDFQKQGSLEFSEYSVCSKPSYENHVASKMSSNLPSPIESNKQSLSDFKQHSSMKYQDNETQNIQAMITNTSHNSNKKPKIKSSPLMEDEKVSTKLHDYNNYRNFKEQNEIEKAITKPLQKPKHSMSSLEIFHKNSSLIDRLNNELNKELSQNLPETKEQISNEVNNGFCRRQVATNRKKLTMNSKPKNIINNKILDIEEMQKVLIAEALNKSSSKLVKSNTFIEPVCADSSIIKIKPNKKTFSEETNPRTKEKCKPIKPNVNESSCDSLSGNANYKNLTAEDNKNKKYVKCEHSTYSYKDEPFDIDKVKQDLLFTALQSVNKSHNSKKINRSDETLKTINDKQANKETNQKRDTKVSKIKTDGRKERNSIVQSKNEISMSNQGQPCASKDVGSTGEVKSDKKLKTLIQTDNKISKLKTKKNKSNLNKDGKLDIGKIQQMLLEAALKNFNSVPLPIIDIKKSKNSELHQGNIIHHEKRKQVKRKKKKTKCVGEIQEENVSKQKIKTKSIMDPLEDLTANMLSAELKKWKVLKTE